MKIEVEQITGIELAREACSFTIGKESGVSLENLAKCEHSPLRTQMFCVRMYEIPTYVSIHFVRHKIGVEHFVKSNRPDRGGDEITHRNSPVNHLMFCNAHSLIHMARRRLCFQASSGTREVMQRIKIASPQWLYPYLVKECTYRGGMCHELRQCEEMRGKINFSQAF